MPLQRMHATEYKLTKGSFRSHLKALKAVDALGRSRYRVSAGIRFFSRS